MSSALHHAHRLSQGASSDLFLGWGTLIAILVGVHVAAFIFWILMLLANERKSRKAAGKRD